MVHILHLQHHPLDSEFGLAEVEEKAYGEAGGFEVIDALGHVDGVERFGGLEFDQDGVLDEDIRREIADYFAVVEDVNGVLLTV